MSNEQERQAAFNRIADALGREHVYVMDGCRTMTDAMELLAVAVAELLERR